MSIGVVVGSKDPEPWHRGLRDVLELVARERVRQEQMYPDNDLLEFGNGPEIQWLHPYTYETAKQIQVALREDYDSHEKPTWMELIREELAESVEAGDLERLEEELIQVAALAVSCVERIRKKR